MWTKKLFAWGTAGMLLAAVSVMPVSAHGHYHNQAKVPADAICGVCTVSDCTRTGLHVHDQKTYCGYDHEGGYCDGSCGAVRVCTVSGCEETGHHVHDQKTYCGYDHEGGYCDGSCDAVEVCTVNGCEETGHHVHDQKTYCGYHHESGYCDHSCEQTSVPASTQTYGHSGHHRHCR